MNITKINKYNKKNKKTEQHFYKEDKNKNAHSQIKIHLYILENITKIGKDKKVNMMEHKTDITLIKLANTKENWSALLWQSKKQTYTCNNKHIQIQQTSKLPTQKVNENI